MNKLPSILVITKRRKHAELLYKLFRRQGMKSRLLLGGGSKTKVTEALDDAKTGKVRLIVATLSLLAEGTNCPRWDTLVLAAPVGYSGLLKQITGRVCRKHPDKNEPVIYDLVDYLMRVPRYQAEKRKRFYQEFGYNVKTINPEDV